MTTRCYLVSTQRVVVVLLLLNFTAQSSTLYDRCRLGSEICQRPDAAKPKVVPSSRSTSTVTHPRPRGFGPSDATWFTGHARTSMRRQHDMTTARWPISPLELRITEQILLTMVSSEGVTKFKFYMRVLFSFSNLYIVLDGRYSS